MSFPKLDFNSGNSLKSLTDVPLHERRHVSQHNHLAISGFKRIVVVTTFLAALTGCENFLPSSRNSPSAEPSATISSSPVESPLPTETVNTDRPELTRTVEERLKLLLAKTIDTSITAAVCPEKSVAKAGDRMECQVTAESKTFPVMIEFTNSLGAFDWSAKDLLVLSKLEAFIQATIKDRSEIDVAANCGGKIRLAKTGEKFECQISDQQGRSRPVKVTVKNAQGRVDVTL